MSVDMITQQTRQTTSISQHLLHLHLAQEPINMAIAIHPASEADAAEFTPVGMAAFKDDPLHSSLDGPEELTAAQTAEHIEWRTARVKERMAGENVHYFKAVDEATGAIVGYSGWFGPTHTKGLTNDEDLLTGLPTYMDRGVMEQIDRSIAQAKQELMSDRSDYWCKCTPFTCLARVFPDGQADLKSMAVHPDYQRRGIAQRLVQAGVDLADRDGADAYLESSVAGRRLYERCGFETNKEIPFLDGKYVMRCFLRKAK